MHDEATDLVMGPVHANCCVDEGRRSFSISFRHILLSEGRVAHTFRSGHERAPGFGRSEIHIDRLGGNARRIFDSLSASSKVSTMTFDRHSLRVYVSASAEGSFQNNVLELATAISNALGFGNEVQVAPVLQAA